MLYGQHLLLLIVAGQFEDPTIANRPKEQDRRNLTETPPKQHSAPDVSTGFQTGIVLEDDIMEYITETGCVGNGYDNDDATPHSGLETTAS